MIGDMESTLLIDAAYRANFDLPQIPEPDGSYVLNQKLGSADFPGWQAFF